jgi:tRNA (guanine37-N1)-methyltransferase
MDNAAGRLLPLLAAGGMAHVYTFLPREEVSCRHEWFVSQGYEVPHSSGCGNVAPGIFRWVFDLVSRPDREELRPGRLLPYGR